jgi:inhibitor of KinA sporulation pathway (predicted exonuclease)
MSTTVYQSETVKLLDGTEIEIRPLKISLLRQFMKKFEKISDVAQDNDKSMTLLVECVQIAMKQYKPEIAEDVKALEDLLDLPTVYKIVGIASGSDLGSVEDLL